MKKHRRSSRRRRGGLLAALLVLLVLVPVLDGCDATYSDNDLELLTRYRAKNLCSCLFVMERGEKYCSAWTSQAPRLATYSIDWDAREVSTQAMMYWGAKARFVDAERGCVLE